MRFKVQSATLVAAGALSAWPNVAIAQLGPETDEPRGENVIIVTAQKREESIQDVPISVTAFSGDQLTAANIDEMSDLDRLTPGLVVSQSSPARTRVKIRGIGSQKFDVGSDPSVGLFVDEVYVPRFSGMELSLLEVERVEVLKGPQGTLFGRNTPGGAISVVTKAIPDSFEGFAEAGIDNKGSYQIKGGIGGPLSDTFLASISYGQEDRGGFVTNTLTGTDDDTLMRAARLKVLFEPSGTLRISGTAMFTQTKLDALLTSQIPTLPGGLTAPIFAGGSNTPYPASTDPFNIAQDFDGFLNSQALLTLLRIEKDLGAVTLTSVSSYRNSEVNINEDLEHLPLNTVRAPVRETSETLSQELRISGNDFVGGFYYYNDDAYNRYTYELYHHSIVFFPPFLVTTAQVDSSITDIRTSSWAVFGQYDLQLTSAVTLTVGARYTEDTKDFTQAAETTAPVGPPPVGAPPVFLPYSRSDTLKFSSFDPKVTLQFEPNEETLVYATYSQGFKSGGVQFTAFSRAISEQTFGPEHVNAYEVGLKTEWFNRSLRLNGAIFYYDYKDLQQQRIEIVGGGPAAITRNAATAEIKGAEIDAAWTPARGLDLRVAYAYTDAKYKDFVVSPTQNASGNPLQTAPKHTLIGSAEYTHDLPSEWRLGFGVDWYWTDEQFFDVFATDPFTRQGPYNTGMLRATLTSPGDRFSVTVYGQNVTDQRFYDQINRRGAEVQGDIADGARFGIRARWTFGS